MLTRNIDRKQLEILDKQIVKVLSQKGIKFESEKARKVFADNGAKIEGEVVYISEEMFRKAISTVPSSFTVRGREEAYDVEVGTGKQTALCPAYGPVFISRNNKMEDGTAAHAVDFAKLTATSPVLNIMNPFVLTPTDVEVDKLSMFQQAVCLRYSAKPPMLITTGYDITKDCINLVKKINQRNEGDYVAIGLISSLSPLAYDDTMAGAIMALAEEKQPIVLGCYGLMGATAPVTFFDAFITTQCESLAGIVLAQLVNPGVPCLTGNVSGGSDMRFITPTIGSVEECKFAIYTKAMADFYGYPCRGGGSLCDAKQLDYEAGAESAMVMLSTMAAGMDYIIHAVGIQDSFNIVGYEKFVLDEQNIEMFQEILGAEAVTEDSFCDEIINDVPHGDQYIQHEHTFMNMRSQYNPKYSLRGYYETWEKAGAETLMEQVNIAIDKRLADFVMPELDAEKAALLDGYLNV